MVDGCKNKLFNLGLKTEQYWSHFGPHGGSPDLSKVFTMERILLFSPYIKCASQIQLKTRKRKKTLYKNI